MNWVNARLLTAMKLFLTSSDLPDIPQPIVCEAIEDWQGWQQWDRLVVTINPPVTIQKGGGTVCFTRLMLSRVKGARQPAPFFNDHDWVDVFSVERNEKHNITKADWLFVGLLHRTLDAAKEFLRAPPGSNG